MSVRLLTTLLALLLSSHLAAAAVETRTWNDAGSTWTSGSNWDGSSGYPSAATDIAEFGLATVNNQPVLGADTTIMRLVFSGAANVNLTGSGDLTIADASAIVVNAGNDQRIACNIALGANATIQVDAGCQLTISGVISGSHTLTKTGAGTLILSGANSYGGSTTVSAGTLRIGANGSLPAATALTVDAGSFELNTFTQTVAGLTVAAAGGVDLGSGTLTVNNTADCTVAGVISGTGGLAKSGSAVLTLSTINTYSGATSISAGTLRFGVGGCLPATAALSATGGTIDLAGFSQTLGSLTTTAGSITLGGATLAVNNATDETIASAISGSGGLAKGGAGVLILTGTNAYTGTTAISAGTLRLGTGGSLSASTSVALSGGAFDVNGHTQTVTGLNAGAGAGIALGSGQLTVNNAVDCSVAGVISGNGGRLVKTGAGTLTLSGSNTYTGTTTINAGTLRAENAAALGTDAAGTTVAASATLANNAAIASEAVALNGTLRFDSATGSSLGGTLTIGGTPAIEVLQGTNTLGGDVQVNADVPVFVIAGAALTVSDTQVDGTGLMSGFGSGTLTFLDVTDPSTPTVTVLPATDPTTDTMPDWTWNVPGYTYRYTLDGGSPALTTALAFTPGAPLGNGAHTLVVAARDAVGNWSGDGSSTRTIDAVLPYIVARTTLDTNDDGQIDTIRVEFSEDMSGTTGTWTVAGYSQTGTKTWIAAAPPYGMRLDIGLTPLTANPDTGALPLVTYTDNSGAVDLAGNKLPGSAVAATDGAAPKLMKAVGSSSAVTVTFSEPVVTAATGTGDLVSGDFTFVIEKGWSISGFSDGNGLDRSVTFAISEGIKIGIDTAAATSGEIYDLAGNAAGATPQVINTLAVTKETKAAGDWDDKATWADELVPTSDDNVVIKHQVRIPQPTMKDSYVANTLTFDGGGLYADVTPDDYQHTQVTLSTAVVEAKQSARMRNVQLSDSKGGTTIISVASGCVLTLDDDDPAYTAEGQAVGNVVKRGLGTLVWDTPPNQWVAMAGWPSGISVEAGTFRMKQARYDGSDLNVAGGATFDMQTNFAPATLAGQGTITNSTTASRQLTLQISSTWGGRIEDGNGTINVLLASGSSHQWSGVNTFTGDLYCAASLTISGGKALPDVGAMRMDGAMLTINTPETISVLSVYANSTISGGVLTVTGLSTFNAGVLTTIASDGTLALTNAADSVGSGQFSVGTDCTLSVTRGGHLTGAVVLNGGTLAVNGDTTVSRTVSLAGAGTIDIAAGRTVELTTAIAGVQPLTKSGGGTLALTSASASAQSTTTVTGGTLRIANDNQLGAGALTLNGGTLAVESVDVTTARALAIGAGGGSVQVATGLVLTWNGVVSGGGAFAKLGNGTLDLTRDNAFTGALGVAAGLVRAGNGVSLGASGAGQGTSVADGASLEVYGDITVAEPLRLTGAGLGQAGVLISGTGSQILTGAIVVDRAGLPVTVAVGSGSSLRVQGAISGTSGVAKIGSGGLELTSTSNSFVGQITVGAGVLSVGSGAAVAANSCLGDAANEVVLADGTLRALVDLTGADRVVRVTALGGTIDTNNHVLTLPGMDTSPGQDLTLTGPGTLAFNIPYDTVRNLSGSLLIPAGTSAGLNLATSGTGTDPGTLIIADGSNTWNGACTVASGRLVVNGLVPGAVSIAGGATLAGSGTVGALSVASGGTVSPGAIVSGGTPSPGVLRAASLVLDGGTLLRFDLGTANDLLSVTGTATITGTPETQPTPVTARTLTVIGSPSATSFNSNTADYVLIAAGTLVWENGAITDPPTYEAGITLPPPYRVARDGSSLILQRNRAPSVLTGVAATAGPPAVAAHADATTTPPAYNIGPPGSSVMFNVDVDADPSVIPLVSAIDPEGTVASSLFFTLKLDPSQGQIQWDADATAGTNWQAVTVDGAYQTWTQADIEAGRVRYLSTGTVGGNDAILYDVHDAAGATSPLYLMRFTIDGNGPPVISNTPNVVWEEQATKPGEWGAIAASATVLDADTPILDGGLLQIDLFNFEDGDELGLSGNEVSVTAGNVSVSGVTIGTLVATSNSLSIALNDEALVARVQVLLRSVSFRTSNPAPLATGRSITITAKDGSGGGASTIVAFGLTVDQYNDAPTLPATLIATVPGLSRSGTLTPVDPEGQALAELAMTLRQSPAYGDLTWTDGSGARSYTYETRFPPQGLAGDVIEDSFVIRVTDATFDNSDARRQVGGSVDTTRYESRFADYVVRIRITNSGSGLAFLNVPRMTVGPPNGAFSYLPQMQTPAGAGTLTFELVDRPMAVPLGTGSGELNFNPSSGRIDWPDVPVPAVGLPQYWRFGILATDPVTGSAALLPIMLRVGPGGTNG